MIESLTERDGEKEREREIERECNRESLPFFQGTSNIIILIKNY